MQIIYFISTYVNPLIWMLVPVRQYKTRYFNYFLIGAFSDPLGIIYSRVINHSNNISLYIITGYLTFAALFPLKEVKKHFVSWLIPLVILIGFEIFLNQLQELLFILMLVHLSILFKFLYDMLKVFSERGAVDFLLIILIFYQLGNLTKIGSVITGLTTHIYYYYFITNIIATLVGILFIIVKYGSSKFIYNLR